MTPKKAAMFDSLYSEARAAQVAAFFLFRSGQSMEILKLMKLMYLAERRAYEMYGEPLTGDLLAALENGPILSHTYNHAKRMEGQSHDAWAEWVSERNGNLIELRHQINDPVADLLELSQADIEAMESVWLQFGHLTASQLVQFCHDKCAEWEYPGKGTSKPIPHDRFFANIGYRQDEARERINDLRGLAEVRRVFRSV